VRLVASRQAIVELGDGAPPDRRAELAERARPLRDGHRKQRLTRLAHFRPLGHEPQPIEVDVGAAQHRDQRLIARALPLDPGLETCGGQRTGRLHHAPRVVEDVLDRGADLVVRHAYDFVDRLLHDRERPLADFPHGHPIGEEPDMFELHAPPDRARSVHRVGFEWLDADDLHVRPERLDVPGNTGDEAAAADRHEHRGQTLLAVPQDLGADGPLSCNHQRIVERMDDGHPVFGGQRVAVRLGIGITVAGQHDLRAHRPHRLHLDLRRGLRHDDDRAQLELAGGVGDALRVIAGACRDDTARALPVRQMRDLVVGSAQLEAEDGLEILALEEDLIAQPERQAGRRVERRLPRHVVNAAGEHVVEQLGELGGHGHGAVY
jgi:hypothetical protein